MKKNRNSDFFMRNKCCIPVLIAGINTKAKSMRVFRQKYAPKLAVLLTAQGANQQDNGLLHAPLYLASCLFA